MKKWLWLAVAVLVALLAWTAAGPYRTVNAIRDAAQARDAQAMAEQVDFPALRSSLKAQLSDRLLREVGTPSPDRSEEHTSELQSLMRISYAVFCLKKKTNNEALRY